MPQKRSNIRIFRVKNCEAQIIRELEHEVWGELNITSKYDISYLVRFAYCFAAKDASRIIGAIIAMKTRNDEVKVLDLFVKKEYRNKGVGMKLYKRLLKEVMNLTVIAFVNTENLASIKMHLKLGFKKTKKENDVFNIGNEDSWWVMKLFN